MKVPVTPTLTIDTDDEISPVKLTNESGELTLTRQEWDTLMIQAINAYKLDPVAYDQWEEAQNGKD